MVVGGFPALMFLAVMVFAGHPEFVEPGVTGSGELEHVVDVDEVGAATAHDFAADTPELEHGALMGGGTPFGMGHVQHVDAVFDHDGQRRVTQQ